MRGDAGQLISPWAAPRVSLPTLNEDIRADVCVIGAGITGISCAYQLTRRGKSVVVIDDGPVAGGESGRTTAHLTCAIDDRYYHLERLHGTEGAWIAAESHRAAIDAIEETIRREKIDCQFERVNGYLFNPRGQSQENLVQEMEAGIRAGLSDLEMLPRAPIKDYDTGPALRFGQQAQFNPTEYLEALVRICKKSGARFYGGTHAQAVNGGYPCHVVTRDDLTITCDAVVVATNSPFNDRVVLHTKQAAYRTYAIALGIPRNAVAKALYWDTSNPYHYVRLQDRELLRESLLLVGGEDHKTGQENDSAARFARLEQWARERFPAATSVEYQWSGQVLEPVDGVAFIGINPMDKDNIFIATGDSGMGMTHGTIASILLTDLIHGIPNHWAKLYDPARKTLLAMPRFALENANVVAQYSDWMTGGDVDSVDDIALGDGAILRQGLNKLAVYRDRKGGCHAFSAVCPHLGGIVAWNSAERTWDCPCHGSRFNAEGRVINGPCAGNMHPTVLEREKRRRAL